MNTSKVIIGGVVSGLIFYGISIAIWGAFKFLPIVPLSIAISADGLQTGWQVEHLMVSLFVGLMWAVGYAVYGRAKASGWQYGIVIFAVGSLPAFVANFVIAPAARSMIVYGGIIALVSALLAGKAIALIVKK